MNTIKFSGSIKGFKLVTKGEDGYWVLQIECVEDTSIRTFPNQFRGDIDFNGAFDSSAANDAWNKVNLPVADYNIKYNIQFSEISEEVKLTNIAATRKIIKGTENVWMTVYMLTFICDPEKDNIKSLAWFTNRKEIDPETGKKAFAVYDVTLEPMESEPVVTEIANED